MTSSSPIFALAQINVTVGDIPGNVDKILSYFKQAESKHADLVIFPELAVIGYPAEDLVYRPAFQTAALDALILLAKATLHSKTAMLVGNLHIKDEKLYNAAYFIEKGHITSIHLKATLPNYGVFDEQRVFHAGPAPTTHLFHGIKLGICICEDMWYAPNIEGLAKQGAELCLTLNASPFDKTKQAQRIELIEAYSQRYLLPFAYVNLVGAQDELVFDGHSFVSDGKGTVTAVAPAFEEALVLFSAKDLTPISNHSPASPLPVEALLYEAMMLALRDYIRKNNFPGVLIGMSGGIDSAISAAIAVDALGSSRVKLVMMPSMYTSQSSLDDAVRCANKLGITLDTLPITESYETMLTALTPFFAGKSADITEENLQSRLRGAMLMALSNKLGYMVLTTGNKSEMAVGYATLYGDMCGGFNVLKDLYKTEVYNVARWRNHHRPTHALGPKGKVIPDNILTKAPTAELRPDQRDSDSLPLYEELDDILYKLIEEECSTALLVEAGYDRKTVEKISHLLYLAEYKRRQAPPGVKLSKRSFGRERRYPITNRFRD